MANVTISGLSTEATELNGSDWIEIEQGGDSKKAQATLFFPVGAGLDHYGTTPPAGFLAMDGSAISRTTYAALFAEIGTTWGNGDGSTTFNLPDMRETVSVGTGTRGSGVASHDTYNVGEFKDDQMQGHWHDVYDTSNSGVDWVPGSISGPNRTLLSSKTSNLNDAEIVRDPVSDSTNGTPRTGTTTRTKQAGVLKCIKY